MANEIAERARCTGCGHAFAKDEAAFCDTCANDDDFDEIPSTAGVSMAVVRAWADRQRLLHGMAPEVVAELERCATDIEEGFRG